MVPALIDLHVRPTLAEGASLDLLAMAKVAREQGLNGMVVFGLDAPLDLATAAAATEETGVSIYTGVELDTDVGRILCLPAEIDGWFRAGSWQELANGAGPGVYPCAAIVEAFAGRGGAVVVAQPFDRDLAHPCAEAAFAATAGLTAVIVASDPRHAVSNERAVTAARAAKLSCVAGSAAAPGAPQFGKVATFFATPPATQAQLVQGLRRGRVWPVEIGYKAATSARASERTRASTAGDADGSEKKAREPVKRTSRRRRGADEDNRGNRLDLKRLDRPIRSQYDARQPDFDPIARLYGIDIRRANPLVHLNHMSDDELDRINGNRNRGADPNVMSRPDFGELRAERHHISLLLKTIDPHRHDVQDSIAMRFALEGVSDDATQPTAPSNDSRPNRPNKGNANGRGRRRRGRRRRD